MTTPDPARRTLAVHLAAEVRRLREAKRIPMTELAERLTALGHPIARLGLHRLERGERKVDMDELVALARAFDVPPITLLFPIGHADQTELQPGEYVDPWTAAKWFMGKGTLTPDGALPAESAVIRIYEEHDRLTEEVDQAMADLELWPGPDDDEKRAQARKLRIALRDLRALRAQMRQRDLRVPPMPDHLAIVDQVNMFFLTDTELAAAGRGLAGRYPSGTLMERMPDGTERPVDFNDYRARVADDLFEGPSERDDAP